MFLEKRAFLLTSALTSVLTSTRDNQSVAAPWLVSQLEIGHPGWKGSRLRWRIAPVVGPRGAVAVAQLVKNAARRSRSRSLLVVAAGCLSAGLGLAACSSGGPALASHGTPSTTSPADAASRVEAQVMTAWRAAENAFYAAEADPKGLSSTALTATMVDPELLLVRRNLAGDLQEGFIGRGTWDLGTPRVVSLGPAEGHPTTATVKSCVRDGLILINEHTRKPAAGLAGTADWAGETSTMVLTSSNWKLSQQSSVANSDRTIACAGIVP